MKVLRIVLRILGGLAVLLLIGALALVIIYPAEYVRRLVTYFEADVYDYTRFPERAVRPAAEPLALRAPADPLAEEAHVRTALEELIVGDVGGLEGLLELTKTQSFIVIQDGTLLYEYYAAGAQRDTIVTSFSMAKSFVSAMVGVAVQEGAIGSVDDPITKYLPELIERDPRFGQITIRHLLDMSSGIHYVENSFFNGDDALTYYYPDLRRLALEKTRIDGAPGETWLYNNYHPLLLGLILERATGMPVAEYLESRIWQPMGAEYPASWSLDSEQTGFEKMESGINARAVDFARFGMLYLNEGAAGGRQVVPAEWVRASLRPDTDRWEGEYYPEWMEEPPFGRFYHHDLWWGVQRVDGSAVHLAQGNHGQYIFIDPEKRLVIVRNGETQGTDWVGFFVEFANAWGE